MWTVDAAVLAGVDDVAELEVEARDDVVRGRGIIVREVPAPEVLELVGVLAEPPATVLVGWLELPPQAAKLMANAASIDARHRLSGL